jgi:beta-glucosidase
MISRFPVALGLILCSLSCAGQSSDGSSAGAREQAQKQAAELVSRMTLEEKISQMQNGSVAIPRLGVPAYNWWNEGLHGIARSGYATVFPQAIGMAAAWDAELQQRIGTVVGVEARAKYNQAIKDDNHNIFFGLTVWSPNVNIFRDPRWGRGQETYGEDPTLTGRLAVAYVRGLQGDGPDHPMVIATPKHFAVHSGPESLRHRFDVTPTAKDLEETYLPQFRAGITEGHAGSLMCAYNDVDGTPACANTMLLAKTLREAWGFNGFVTSDCGAVEDFSSANGHHFAPDQEHASALAVRAGTDTTCGREYTHLVEAVHDQLITESEIDTAAQRLFTARFLLGMMARDESDARARIPFSEVDSVAHRKLALDAARASIVLLKNDKDFLPLKKTVRRVAVIGPNAAVLSVLEGNYNGVPSAPVLPLDGLEQRLGGSAKVLYAQGSPLVEELPIVAPRTLFNPAITASANGLLGEYFDNTDLSGKPALSRADAQIDFDWNAASPAPGVDTKAFSVRWSGTITPPGPGDYTFPIQTPDCWPCDDEEDFRVYLDGALLEAASTVRTEGKRTSAEPVQLHFADAKAHAFRFEYVHRSALFAAGVTLRWKPPLDVLRAQAVEAARQADVVIAFVGLSPELEGEESGLKIPGFLGGDRTSLELPAVQQQMLEAVAATGKPMVVVLMSGSAVASRWAQEHANAVLEAWYPGEQGGAAIADVLLGDYSPAGRLPVTFYASADQLPAFEDYSMRNRTYRYFNGTPLYEFGYGLSYTRFRYENVRLSSAHIAAGEPLSVEADVRNVGARAGDEVVEIYLTPPAGADAPRHSLVGFARVSLGVGAVQHVRLVLSARDLSTVSADGVRAVRPGDYRIFAGGSQPNEKQPGDQTANVTIVGTKELAK